MPSLLRLLARESYFWLPVDNPANFCSTHPRAPNRVTQDCGSFSRVQYVFPSCCIDIHFTNVIASNCYGESDWTCFDPSPKARHRPPIALRHTTPTPRSTTLHNNDHLALSYSILETDAIYSYLRCCPNLEPTVVKVASKCHISQQACPLAASAI
jgi:hypothetical protein